MRAAVVRTHSGPFLVEDLRDPRPGPGEVLVKVASCGVCHTDLHARDGGVAFPVPAVFGHEIAGTVVEAGEGVTRLRPGQRVVGAFSMPCGTCGMCAAGRYELCDEFFARNRLKGQLYDGTTRLFDAQGEPIAMYSMGGLAEYAVIPELGVGVLPEGVPFEECAILGCAFLTSYGALVHVGDLQPGQSVAVIGAGGVGLSVVHLARALGAGQVIAVDLSRDRLDTALELGATGVVNGSETDAVAAVRDLTAGKGAELVLEAIGNRITFRQATEMVADGGRCVMIGIAPSGQTAEVEITRLVRRKIQICGSFGGRPPRDIEHLAELVAAGKLQPQRLISRRFSLDEADEAYQLLHDGKIVGRALIEMGA